MAVVRLRFCAQADPVSWWIRYLTRGAYSHVDFALNDGTYLGARFYGGVQIRAADYIHPSTSCFVTARLPGECSRAILAWARSQIGKPYDWRALLGDAVRRDWHDDGQWFCSELVAEAFARGGVPLVRQLHVNRVMPADLLLSPFLIEEGGLP